MSTKLELKQPSSVFYDHLDSIVDNEKNTKQHFNKAVELARAEEFTDLEIALLMKDYLKDKLPPRTVYSWIKPLEGKIEQSSVQNRQSAEIVDKKHIEQSTTIEEEYPTVHNPLIERPLAYQKEKAVDVVEENENLKIKNESLQKQVNQLKDVVSKKSIVTAEEEIKNFDKVFGLLPNDNIDTFKHPNGTLFLFERVWLTLDSQDKHRRFKYRWYVERMK